MVETVVGAAAVPHDLLALSGLGAPHYVDAFTIPTGDVDGSAEDWARAVLEETPLARRWARTLWRCLGLRLGPRGSRDHVAGWRIAARGPDWVRLETASWYLTANALVRSRDRRLSVAVLLRFDRPVAAVVWAPVSVAHRRAVPEMLRQAVGARS